MEKFIYPTSANPKVSITAHSDLILKGTDDLELVVKVDSPEDYKVEQIEDRFTIQSRVSLQVRVPRGADVEIEFAQGETVIKALDGNLTIQAISGDLTLRSVADTALETVRGNFVAKNVMGNLTVALIAGNVVLRDIQGECKLESVRGNLQISELDGGLEADVHGNASLSLDPTPGVEYLVNARGNLTCSLVEDASVDIQIERAGRISLQIPGYEELKNVQAPYQLTLGDGDARLKMSAGGALLLAGNMSPGINFPEVSVDLEGEFEGMAEDIEQQIGQQIQAQMNMIEQQIQSQLANMTLRMGAVGMSPEQMERIQRRAKEASERAAARAQDKIRQAQERLERRMASAHQKMEQKARVAEARAHRREYRVHKPFEWHWTPPPTPPTPPEAVQVSDEERLVILRMLEQKKISLEEAERLLSALEGKE